jgi:hypothetical protein
LAAAPDEIAFLGQTSLDHLGFEVTAKGAFHRAPGADQP